MNAQWKYLAMIALAFVVFLFTMCTEVADRWSRTFDLYTSYRAASQKLRLPEDLELRKTELRGQVLEFRAILKTRSVEFEQTQIGTFEFLSERAKENKIHIESLVPVASSSSALVQQVTFNAALVADYHSIARYINSIESGPITVQIRRLDLSGETPSASLVRADLEGTAFLLTRRQRQ